MLSHYLFCENILVLLPSRRRTCLCGQQGPVGAAKWDAMLSYVHEIRFAAPQSINNNPIARPSTVWKGKQKLCHFEHQRRGYGVCTSEAYV
jgi:hypothetical protein